MKIKYLGIIKNDTKPAVELTCTKIVDDVSFFQKTAVAEFMTLFAQKSAETTRPGQRRDIEEQSQRLHIYARVEGVAAVMITDDEYPSIVAHQILSQALDDFLIKFSRSSWQSGNTRLPFDQALQIMAMKCQDPKKASGIVKVQQELDETKIVLYKTIEAVLERGEKLDTLVAKSEGLSWQSKAFYQGAKNNNKCCVLM